MVAIPHPEPLNSCHLVVAPRRHVANFYALDVQEQHLIWDALSQLSRRIASTMEVAGFYAGFVDAPSEGDLEFHTHVHLLPRIAGQRVALPTEGEWVDLGLQP